MNMREAKKKWWEENAIYNMGNGQHGHVCDLAWQAACKWMQEKQIEKDAEICVEIAAKHDKPTRSEEMYGATECEEAIRNQERE